MTNRARWTRRDWTTVAASAAVVVLLSGVIAGAFALVSGGSSTGAAVTLEPAGSSGADPFTASVETGPAVEFPGNVLAITVAARKTLPSDPKTHTLLAAATAPGLYGGSGDVHVCDPQQLVSFLNQHSEKAAAWASVLGIAPTDIAAYVGSLTPVVLMSDTLVTNHGYRNGHATTLQSVLQAGTAVMVDAYGVPRVKCNCGNPLAPPALISPTHYRGTPWPGYASTQVTVVQSGPTIGEITVINIRTGETYTQPFGTRAGEFVAAAIGSGNETTISTSQDGTTWNTVGVLPEGMKGLAWGNGKWLTLESNRPSGTKVLESTDLRSWRAVASMPDDLTDAAYGNGRWIAVGKVAVRSTSTDPLAGEFPPAAVYASADGRAWTRVASLDKAPPFTSVAYAGGEWIAVGNGIHQGGEPSMTYRSTDGTTWTRQNDTGLDSSEAEGHLAFGSGQWALGGLDISPSSYTTGSPSGVVGLSRDGVNWTVAPGAHFAGNQISGIAYGDGEWLVAARNGDVFSSADTKTWSRRAHLSGAAELAFGGNAASGPTSPASTTTTTTAQAASSLARIDWKNYSYQDFACGTLATVKFTNGAWTVPGTKGTFAECSIHLTAVDYADVTGDGVPDAIVNLHGSASPVIEGQSDVTTVFTTSADRLTNHGYINGLSFPPYPAASGITTWMPHAVGSEPLCCPSQYEKDVYKYSSSTGKYTRAGTTYVPAGELPKR